MKQSIKILLVCLVLLAAPVWAYGTTVTVNDNTVGTGTNQFNYQGSGWLYGACSACYANDNHWDLTTNDYFTFQFSGQQAVVYGSMDFNGGIAAYSVDGGAETNFDDYSASRVDNVFLFATPILTTGTHTLKVRVTGLKNSASTNIVLPADRIDVISGLTAVTVNDNTLGTGNSQFNYQGSGWLYGSCSLCYANDNHWDLTTNDYFTFQFNGQQAVVYGSMDFNGGIAAYSVDGGAERNFDDYAASRVDNVFLFATPILYTGLHTLKVRVTGLKNPSSTNIVLPADRIDVISSSLPSGWTDLDIGSPGLAGSATYSGTTYTVKGGGADIWGTSDQFNYAETAANGDVTITSRVVSQQNTNAWAKAGVMIRDTTGANAAHVYVYVTPSNGAVLQYRSSTGASASIPNMTAGLVAPYWVRLVRSGSTFTGSISPDDTTWTTLGSVTATIATNALGGLAVTAHDNTQLNTSTFDNVTMSGGGGGGTVATPTFSPVAGTYGSAQTVTINDSTAGATIHYTTNGSNPTATSTTYTAPINVSTSETVKAIGVETGWTTSAVGSATYTISLTVATPTFSPGAGTYSSAQTVTISDATSGATLHYTTDGSTPTASSTTYSTPITVSTSETVKALGVKSGYTNSAIGSAAYTISSGSGHTWYIRHDGGDNVQCTGTTNAAYPGGTGMKACAYNHPFQMLSWSGGWTSFASGDTMQFADPPTNTTPYYMGEENGGVGSDWQPTVGGICPAPNSPHPQGDTCALPILPSNVTIKGQNYGNCHTAGHTGLVNPTILSGINSTFAVLQVQGTSNVTISCIEVTQPDSCTSAGYSYGPGQCGGTSNYVDYAGLMLEYQTAQGPANMTLTDFAVVGVQNRGIMGSHLNRLSTDTFTASDIYLIGNGQAGWDGDGGGCNTSCESVGTMNLSYVDIEWNGCMAVKPYNIGISPETAPNSFNYCYGQNTSGYGDGFVQLAAGNLTLNMTHSKFKYNTQDGFDGAHLSDDSTTSPATTITDSWSEGNAGQTFKIGAGASSTAINNVSISNCHVLSQAASFPNNPSGWTTLDGGDTCRASGDEWALTLRPGTSITLENNTSVGYGTTMYDLECSLSFPNCNGGTVVFTNNISKGYPDPGNSGQLASGWYLGPEINTTMVTADHNLWNTMRTLCPDNTLSGETNYVCADPLLTGESNIDAINPSPTSTSPVIGAGIFIPDVTKDYNGTTRPNPPSIGAIE